MIFKSTVEFARYIPVDINLKFEIIKPSIEEAEQLFIKDLLGDLYAPFLADYTANFTEVANGMSEENKALLPYVQRSLAYYAGYLMVEHVGVQVGSSGIQQTVGRDSQPAPRWKIRDLQMKYINSGDRFADDLLSFLEENASPTVYDEWYADIDANTKMSGAIVYSTKVASKYIDINESRRVFLRLKKRITDIETNHIKSLICGDQFEALITAIQTGGIALTAQVVALIAKLEPLISKKALYLTMPSLRISISNEGIHLLSSGEGSVKQEHATDAQVKMLMDDLRDGEFGYLADEDNLKKFISDNIADYPLIEESACYSATAISRKWVADNDPCNKHFSV